jgi:hypothetical protein
MPGPADSISRKFGRQAIGPDPGTYHAARPAYPDRPPPRIPPTPFQHRQNRETILGTAGRIARDEFDNCVHLTIITSLYIARRQHKVARK